MTTHSSPAAARHRRVLDEQVCRLICPIASAMVGVCLTGIGLLHVGVAIGRRASIADDLLAIDARAREAARAAVGRSGI